MTFQRIYTDSTWWFSVFRSEQTGDYVLLATVPGVGCYDIAMRLTSDEVSLFHDRPSEFVGLAKDFVASREMPIFQARRISFRVHGPDVLETDEP